MILPASTPLLAAIKHLTRLFCLGPLSDEASWYLVYRSEVLPDPVPGWEKRIVELGDGRPLVEIIQVLYQEQLSRGAGLVDVGIWKGLFDCSVTNTINDLANRGVIQIKLGNQSERRNSLSATGNYKKASTNNGIASRRRWPIREPGIASSRRYRYNGKYRSNKAAPQIGTTGSGTPERTKIARVLETVANSLEGIISSSPFHPVQSPQRSAASVLLGFLTRVAHRGSGRDNEHLNRAKGVEGG